MKQPVMALDNLETFFNIKKALQREKITTRELSMLIGIKLFETNGSGRSIQAIQRFCETMGWCYHYRTAEMLTKRLMDKGLVTKKGRNVSINADGMLLLSRLDRKLKKVSIASAA